MNFRTTREIKTYLGSYLIIHRTDGAPIMTYLGTKYDPHAIFSSYEQFKKDFCPPGEVDCTEVLCRRQGLSFTPMVMEFHGGGWSKEARWVLDTVAKHVDACWNTDAEA